MREYRRTSYWIKTWHFENKELNIWQGMCGQNKVLKCLQVEEEQKEVNMGENEKWSEQAKKLKEKLIWREEGEKMIDTDFFHTLIKDWKRFTATSILSLPASTEQNTYINRTIMCYLNKIVKLFAPIIDKYKCRQN